MRLQPTLLAFRCSRYGERDIIAQKKMIKEKPIKLDQTVFRSEDIFLSGDVLYEKHSPCLQNCF